MTPRGGSLRMTELLASLSLATDLGTGRPLGHGLRTTLIAVGIARRMGLPGGQVRAVQQVSLLRFLGCTADASETARMVGGDEIAFNAVMGPVLNGSRVEMMQAIFGAVGPGRSLAARGGMAVRVALTDPGDGLAAHCEVAAMLGRRLGLGDTVLNGLEAAYERWDGTGYPAGLERDAIPVEIRIATVARDIDLFATAGDDVRAMLADRRGRAYDPDVVDAAGDVVEVPEAEWDAVLAAEPEPVSHVEDLDSSLAVIADFVDLKSPWTRGHSRAVADLAHDAAVEAGLPSADADRLRHAGLVHDVGRVGVPNGIWDKPGPLSTAEWERVRLHPYLTDRVLARCPALADLGSAASSHHERLDGSGYHRTSTADDLPAESRLLAAADVLAALTASRPHRGPFDLTEASDLMRAEVESGRLDGRAVECVVAAAGGEAETEPPANPGGLSDREVEVLAELCAGLTNRQVAEKLFISAKTVGRHVENIYTKIGVSTRAAAAVYAMEQGVLDRAIDPGN